MLTQGIVTPPNLVTELLKPIPVDLIDVGYISEVKVKQAKNAILIKNLITDTKKKNTLSS